MFLVEFGWRGIATGLFGIAAAFAVALALRQVPWVMFDRERRAETIQILGTVITAIGLAVAYVRASQFQRRRWQPTMDRLRRIYYAVRGGGPAISGAMAPSFQPMTASAGREGPAPFITLRNASAEERIAALEAIVNRLIGDDLPSIIGRIAEVKEEVAGVRSLAKSQAANALTEARKSIASVVSNVDRTQTLDLRWAILGLLITAGGMALGWA